MSYDPPRPARARRGPTSCQSPVCMCMCVFMCVCVWVCTYVDNQCKPVCVLGCCRNNILQPASPSQHCDRQSPPAKKRAGARIAPDGSNARLAVTFGIVSVVSTCGLKSCGHVTGRRLLIYCCDSGTCSTMHNTTQHNAAHLKMHRSSCQLAQNTWESVACPQLQDALALSQAGGGLGG